MQNSFKMIRFHCLISTTLFVIFFRTLEPTRGEDLQQISASALRETMFSSCGGVLKDSRGVISTPNFPDPYPVPIHCRWVIEAPADKVIAIFFTQFYMREGLTVAEYAFFSETLYMGKKEFGTISSDRTPTFLVSNKPVLVLDFLVRESGNLHMRVREDLLDVFGFNMTFEIVGKNESVRTDACLYNHCSYTGSCLVSATFGGYRCHCFGDFYGAECQYGRDCEPGVESACLNGGTCRYSIGSTIKSCECPASFEGSKCEKRKDDKRLLAHCLSLGCTHTCGLTNHGDYKCTCRTGYHLSEDKKTCVEKGRTRYLVSFKMYDQNVDLAHLDETRYKQLKKGIENALFQLFQPRLYKVENMTVLNFQPGAVVQFHFFGEKEDSHQAKIIMEEALKSRSIGKYAVDRNYISFEWEPALSIQSIDASEKMPVVEGSEFSLACITQGSSVMQVRWFKDGFAINVQTPYRTMWTTLVPKNSKDQYTAILGFEKALALDSGEFICQVTDWGIIQNKSIHVSVVTVPQPQVFPIAATIHQGARFVITCLSQDDIVGSFGYNWLKNGRILNPSVEPELVEDLFPAGSRLLIPAARTSSTYTCIITSSAGATTKDSTVTVVLAKGSTPTCHPETYLEVKWTKTAANTEDVQYCPKGYTGEVRRLCSLKGDSEVVWEEPDYSKCLSSDFSTIQKKFENLRMGYLTTEVGELMRELRLYLWKTGERFHIAEGEPVVDLLEGMHDYQRRHGGSSEAQFSNNSQVFLDIVSFLLDSPRLIQKQPHVIKLHQQILSHGLLHGSAINSDNFHIFQRSALVLEVGQVPNEGQRILRFPSRKSTRDIKEYSPPSWLTDSVELDFNAWILENLQEVNDSISIAVVFYKNFSAFLPERFLAQYGYGYGSILHRGPDVEYQLHSRIVAVAVQTGQGKAGPTRMSRLRVKARIAHLNHTVNRQVMWNISCGVADFSQGNVQFSMEGCQPIQTGNYSLCQCNRVGTYAVLLTSYAQQDELRYQVGFDVIAGIGCAVCAFFVFLTFFILLVLWRKIKGAITALKLQVCIALIGAYGTILKALHHSLTKEHYPYVVSAIQFFLLSALSLQLCMGLTVYMEFVNMKGVRYPELKLAAMGWAIPTIVVGATLAAQVPEGFKLNSWWILRETNYFYAYSASAVIISMLQVMLVTAMKSELRVHKKLETSKHSRSANRSRLLNRSLVIVFFLIAVSSCSYFYINFKDEMYKYAFATTSGLLGFAVFLCYTVCSENAHSLCSSSYTIEEEEEKQDPRVRGKAVSFPSILKPEIVSDSYIGSKIPDTLEVDSEMEKLHNLRFRMYPGEMEWKEVDHLLVDKQTASVVRDFTVHQQRSPLPVPKPKVDVLPREHQWNNAQEPTEQLNSPIQLQQLEDSPKNSQINLKDVQGLPPDGQECYVPFCEMSPAPDILGPTTKSGFFAISTAGLQVGASGSRLSTFVGNADGVCTSAKDSERTGSYSTFRPQGVDAKHATSRKHSKEDLQTKSAESSSKKGEKSVVLKTPDIGDESISMKKKEVLGLRVESPVVPSLHPESALSSDKAQSSSKKEWNITRV